MSYYSTTSSSGALPPPPPPSQNGGSSYYGSFPQPPPPQSSSSSSMPNLPPSYATLPIGVYSTFAHGTGTCSCPACELAQRYAVVYQKQFPAMTPDCAETIKIHEAINKNKCSAPCEMWDNYGFCFHGITCMFPHRSNVDDFMPAKPMSNGGQQRLIKESDRTKSVNQLTEDINKMVEEQSNDVFRCNVCGYDKVFDSSCIIKVGEMFSYMTCPRCTSPLYQPYIVLIVEAALRETGGKDHNAYKALIDKLRSILPHMVRIPLSFEAHRLASTYFGWSLVGPEEAAEALTAAICETPMPEASTLISMGSGTGYIEHVFAESLKLLPARKFKKAGSKPEDEGTPVLTEAQANSFSVLAFDEILRESRFSVPVQMGTPDVINSLPDPKNSILLLCWPPFGSPGGPQATMGRDVLRRFMDLGGECVIYIGDVASTGDYDFHILLQQAFRPCPSYRTRHDVNRWIPQEMGLVYAGNDTIGVYKKRQPGDSFAYFAH